MKDYAAELNQDHATELNHCLGAVTNTSVY